MSLNSQPVVPQAQQPPATAKRPLKRNASTMSLPTPPRTRRREKRRVGTQVSLSPISSNDEGEKGEASDDELPRPSKRSRVSEKTTDDQETAFWLARAPSTATTLGSGVITSPEDDDDDDVEALLRRKRNRRNNQASLASPPPSHRKASAPPSTTRTSASPVTPIQHPKELFASLPPSSVESSPDVGSGSQRSGEDRDPFLDNGTDDEGSDEDVGEQRVESAWWEKPYRVMVQCVIFNLILLISPIERRRGKKKVVPNPYWDSQANAPVPINPKSLLDPGHIDFEPDFRCQPRVLFPKLDPDGKPILKRKRAKSQTNGPSTSQAKKHLPLPKEVRSGLSTPDQSDDEADLRLEDSC